MPVWFCGKGESKLMLSLKRKFPDLKPGQAVKPNTLTQLDFN
jgi:hypothetical protein